MQVNGTHSNVEKKNCKVKLILDICVERSYNNVVNESGENNCLKKRRCLQTSTLDLKATAKYTIKIVKILLIGLLSKQKLTVVKLVSSAATGITTEIV